ncbi:ArsR family transcriptional regulator [Agarivorans sp. B2Z047]|uniref:VpaChn25_0724 family phage protein n=1 Tax=Agarivorans sp. B2Z047 TaxID=2652721 RepID=UPI00128C9261|nr:ArsR family transcriptional regulator [Agarivorans sp. B2Z047]MPW30473.1 ArsR family transcriptional regulator [Agarivorans sp. B2Z047]UQN42307.1 ArsR family transcriptional regulator [Agarivorans sp. B2Z047]
MPLKDIIQEDRRLVILRALVEMDGFEANESIIDHCLEVYGHNMSRDSVKTQINWLNEQGLVTLRDIGGCLIVTLTGRGQDVANGAATVPGVKRPRAGS